MKNAIAALCLALSLGASSAFAATDQEKLAVRIKAAHAVLHELMATPDKGIPLDVAAKATCVLVIPSFKKGAFLIGGQYGQGLATCRTGSKGWSAPAFVQMSGASFGLQAGGQATDLVLVGIGHKSMDDILKDKIKLGGDIAASAGPVGRNSQAAISVLANAEFLTYSRSKGLFAGVDLTGDEVNQNKKDTEVFYGEDKTYESILGGQVPVPADAKRFVYTVNELFRKGKMNAAQ